MDLPRVEHRNRHPPPDSQVPPPPIRVLLRLLPAQGLPGDEGRVPSGGSHAAVTSRALGAADWLIRPNPLTKTVTQDGHK